MKESHFLKSLNVKCGPNVIVGLRKENSLRLSNARCNITEIYKKCYVNYESRTRKVIRISQVDFQQKLSLC